MKKSKNNNIILDFGYWVFEFGFSWCKGKVINSSFDALLTILALELPNKPMQMMAIVAAYPIRSSLTSVAETINPKAETKKATTPMPINIQGRTEK